MTNELSALEQQLQDAARESHEAGTRAAHLALRIMALSARAAYPTARYLLLDDSDQGDTADWVGIEDTHLTELESWPEIGQEYAWHLTATHRDSVLPFMRDDQVLRKHMVWSGVRIDIDKVLRAG